MSKSYECIVYYQVYQTVYVDADNEDEASLKASKIFDPEDIEGYSGEINEIIVYSLDEDEEDDNK